MKRSLLRFLVLMRQAIKIFRANDPLRFGAATAFFSTFALPPILIILVSLLGLLFDAKNLGEELLERLRLLFGEGGAGQIQMVLENILAVQRNVIFTVVGGVFLVFVSTTLFVVVQNSLNQLWGVRTKQNRRFWLKLQNRLTALTLILFTGILFLVSLFIEHLLTHLGENLSLLLPSLEVLVLRVVNTLLTLGIVTVWFALLFKFLPDIRITWKPVWVGAIFTALLFNVGRYLLHRFLLNGQIGSIYGASASVVLVLLFIFYAAMLFFFGAAFTKAYAAYLGQKVVPKPYAVGYELVVLEQEAKPLT